MLKHSLQMVLFLLLFSMILFSIGCQTSEGDNYQNAFNLIKEKTELIELISNQGDARLLITPKWQGRIITSTSNGLNGRCNGWFNKELIKNNENIKGGVGGEDRLWIGPLGGQFSFYFQQIEPISDDNWLVPEAIDGQPYRIVEQNSKKVHFEKIMALTNFIGTNFDLFINREIRIFDKAEITNNLQLEDFDKAVKFVAFESKNTLTNIGYQPLRKETGLVAVWSAGMFEGTDETTVIIPLKEKNVKEKILKYMGPLDEKRLKLDDQTLLFKADGKYRTKIGIPPHLAPSIYGCYSKDRQRLSIVQYQTSNDSLYFNSEVAIQKNPYQGEVIPIYNNGSMDYSPVAEASFYELESTSPMRELGQGKSISHFHRVYHFEGTEEELNSISQQLLGTNLEKLF